MYLWNRAILPCRFLKAENGKQGLYFVVCQWPRPPVTGRCRRRWWPVCQRPTNPVHSDIHMGAVMILKAAIKLTVAFRESAWCWNCRRWGCEERAAPIIPQWEYCLKCGNFYLLPPLPLSLSYHICPTYLFLSKKKKKERYFCFIIFGQKHPLLLNTIVKAKCLSILKNHKMK